MAKASTEGWRPSIWHTFFSFLTVFLSNYFFFNCKSATRGGVPFCRAAFCRQAPPQYGRSIPCGLFWAAFCPNSAFLPKDQIPPLFFRLNLLDFSSSFMLKLSYFSTNLPMKMKFELPTGYRLQFSWLCRALLTYFGGPALIKKQSV